MKLFKGKVRWFNSKLGYGFIYNDKIDKDIYVHYSDIKINGYKNLYENDLVEFTYDVDKNKAIDVRIIKKARYIRNNKNNIPLQFN